jgi:penicillin-binding protein A
LPVAVLALAAFLAGMIVASGSAAVDAAERFARAWAAQQFEDMHAELTPAAQSEFPLEKMSRLYERAQRTATVTGLGDGEAGDENDGVVPVPIQVQTRSFGELDGTVELPVDDGAIAWQPHLVFPGLRPGEKLERRTRAPRRAPIVAADGTPLAEGPASSRTTNGAGGVIAGEVGKAPRARAREMARAGFPEGTPAGTSGLELAFDGLLAGIPGGKLLGVGAGERRVLAESEPQRGKPLRTTIDPDLQDVTAAALGDLFGGVTVLDATNGDVLAVAGVAFSAPQPPGSVFKIITTAAALEDGVSNPDEEFPAVTAATVEGRPIANAHDESCGGDLVESFALSCNSVFAPMGAELGGKRLLEEAEQFGFNNAPTIYDEEALAVTQPPSSTIPDPIGGDLDVAVSAIGQGQVLATPLQMASVAQTIANGGVRSPTSLVRNAELAAKSGEVVAVEPEVAEQLTEMMIEVVRSGTGQAAALPNTVVAGKTGTAELGPAASADPADPSAEVEQEVDAWFTAFAPARKPKLAVAVMIVDADGDGGVVAAPIAREVLAAGL